MATVKWISLPAGSTGIHFINGGTGVNHRLYTPEEEAIILGSGTLEKRLNLLLKKGYNDRTMRGISKKYIKLLDEVRERRSFG